MKKAKYILVTGGAGFIGSHLVERLLNDNKTVVVIDDFSTGSLENLRAAKKNPRLKIIRAKISTCKNLRNPPRIQNLFFISPRPLASNSSSNPRCTFWNPASTSRKFFCAPP